MNTAVHSSWMTVGMYLSCLQNYPWNQVSLLPCRCVCKTRAIDERSFLLSCVFPCVKVCGLSSTHVGLNCHRWRLLFQLHVCIYAMVRSQGIDVTYAHYSLLLSAFVTQEVFTKYWLFLCLSHMRQHKLYGIFTLVILLCHARGLLRSDCTLGQK